MAILVELAVIVAVTFLIGRTLSIWLRHRANMQREHAVHERKLESLGKASDIAALILTDRELAKQVQRELAEKLKDEG